MSESSANVDCAFGFTGRETDPESDLNYYRARYYDPLLGQFIAEDPISFDASDPMCRVWFNGRAREAWHGWLHGRVHCRCVPAGVH